jgi:hypothetical protein
MVDILLDPSSPTSPTFGELFQSGRLPPQLLIPDEDPMPEVPPRAPVNVTVEEAKQWVKETESQSPFGILQLSRTLELSAETAGALAEFRGEMLILGLKTLTPEVAEALATSQAATLWLPSVTSVSPEVAASLAKTKGKLVLSGLSELSSVPLAEKLVSRPGALSFPFLTSISPEIASVLAKSSRSLTLAGLTRVPLEVQEKLAQTPGALYLPNLKSLDSMPLATKLTSGFVVLSQLEKISAEQAKLLPQAKGAASFFGGIFLPMAAVTPEVAAAFKPDPNGAITSPVNLTLVGDGPLSDDAFRTLLQSRVTLVLPHLEKLSPNQKRILSELSTERKTQPGLPPLAPLILTGVTELDSTFLAQRLVGGGIGFVGVQGNQGITSLSAEVAAALGSLPDNVQKLADGTEVVQPSGSLNFSRFGLSCTGNGSPAVQEKLGVNLAPGAAGRLAGNHPPDGAADIQLNLGHPLAPGRIRRRLCRDSHASADGRGQHLVSQFEQSLSGSRPDSGEIAKPGFSRCRQRHEIQQFPEVDLGRNRRLRHPLSGIGR